MPEIRKLLKLAKNAYAVTIPTKYREAIGLKFGDYVSIHMMAKDFIIIRRQAPPEKI